MLSLVNLNMISFSIIYTVIALQFLKITSISFLLSIRYFFYFFLFYLIYFFNFVVYYFDRINSLEHRTGRTVADLKYVYHNSSSCRKFGVSFYTFFYNSISHTNVVYSVIAKCIFQFENTRWVSK